MRPVNPFIVSGKILPEYFCDRKSEAAFLTKSIVNGNNLVLISPRRMGKTGLIKYCFENCGLAEDYNTFFIDILQTSSLREFTYILGREIFNALRPRGIKMVETFMTMLHSLSGKFGFDTMTGTPTFNIQLGDIVAPEYTLEEIFAYISSSEKRCVIAIDEFQQIAKYPEKNVEALLRTHIQSTANADFIFAGSERHLMQQIFSSSGRPFFNSATFLELKEIPLDIYTEFVVRLFESRGKSIKPKSVEYIYTLFRGHTYYMQKAFNYGFANTPAGAVCDESILEESVAEMLHSYDTVFRETLSQLSLRQKELLFAIAKTGNARSITSAAFIRDNALTSSSSVQAAAKTLIERDIISAADNIYTVSDRLFDTWLKRFMTP